MRLNIGVRKQKKGLAMTTQYVVPALTDEFDLDARALTNPALNAGAPSAVDPSHVGAPSAVVTAL